MDLIDKRCIIRSKNRSYIGSIVDEETNSITIQGFEAIVDPNKGIFCPKLLEFAEKLSTIQDAHNLIVISNHGYINHDDKIWWLETFLDFCRQNNQKFTFSISEIDNIEILIQKSSNHLLPYIITHNSMDHKSIKEYNEALDILFHDLPNEFIIFMIVDRKIVYSSGDDVLGAIVLLSQKAKKIVEEKNWLIKNIIEVF